MAPIGLLHDFRPARYLETPFKSAADLMEVILQLGIDGVVRSGWYESADLWSPSLFARYAAPQLAAEIDAAKAAGVAMIYLMDSGVPPLLPQLAQLEFDCLATAPFLNGADKSPAPVANQTVAVV